MGRQRPVLAGLMGTLGAIAMYGAHLRPWMYTWGADTDELGASYAGDDLVASPTPTTTRAITVDAPIHDVWPWLVQIGEGRGGFYSYSWLEWAAGAGIRNAETIHPEWQDVRVGDTIWLAKRYGEGARQVVAAVEPNCHLVLVSADDFARLQRGEKAAGAWAFYLRRRGGRTRLIARGSGGAVGHALFDIGHFIMEQKMMRGIRDRAQQTRRDETTALLRKRLPPGRSVARAAATGSLVEFR